MNNTFFVVTLLTGVTLALAPVMAGQRLNDGLIGAGAGALVAGPIGAIGGGAIGFLAGPTLAHELGIHRRHPRYAAR